VHHATRYVTWLVRNYRHADGYFGTALDQAIREALLLQSSDWNFILKTGTQTEYADARIRTHTHRLRHLGHIVQSGKLDEDEARWVSDVCARDTFFAGLAGDELRRPFDA
jgi:1,4-alpha-glucan branching enzyme